MKKFFLKTRNLIEQKLYMNDHCMDLIYTVHVFVCESEFQDGHHGREKFSIQCRNDPIEKGYEHLF